MDICGQCIRDMIQKNYRMTSYMSWNICQSHRYMYCYTWEGIVNSLRRVLVEKMQKHVRIVPVRGRKVDYRKIEQISLEKCTMHFL